MDQEKAHEIALDLNSWLQNAVGDVAFGCDTWADVESMFGDSRGWKSKIKVAKKWPVTDIQGWLADELYDDPGTCHDLLGDRIHDEGRGDYEDMIMIAEAIIELGVHDGLQKACEDMIKDWKGRIKSNEKRLQREAEAVALGDSHVKPV